VSLDTPDIQDQAREQAQTHQGNEAATPITITKNPAVTTEKAKDTVKVPGIPVTPKETTQSPTQPETTEAIKQVPVDTYIIAAGDTLWDIAVDIYGDGSRWTEIYEKNKDTINALDSRNAVDHGHWIHEGITLQIE
jgi:5'-nucleotidase